MTLAHIFDAARLASREYFVAITPAIHESRKILLG